MKTKLLVAVFLAAIVIANLLTAHFGPGVSIINAFLLIGLDITTRDKLHEEWGGNHLGLKMGGLILAGSAISYALGAGPVATASAVAFAAATAADTLVYQGLRKRGWFTKVNGSNTVSALVDSITFPTLAFGGFMLPIVVAQFSAKVLGGAVWSFILKGRNRRAEAKAFA